MDINHETQKLIKNKMLKNPREIRQFEQCIADILNMNKVEHIQNLCSGFDDATEHDEVMFGLVHAIESYEKNFGSKLPLLMMAKALPNMLPHAERWAIILHKRILNHEPSKNMYIEVVETNEPITKEIVFRLVNDIKKENPEKFELVLD